MKTPFLDLIWALEGKKTCSDLDKPLMWFLKQKSRIQWLKLGDQNTSLMKIKAQRIRGARAFTTYIGNSILIMENSDLGGCETLETPNIFLFPSVLSLLLF